MLFINGCKKKTPPPEEVATSEAVIEEQQEFPVMEPIEEEKYEEPVVEESQVEEATVEAVVEEPPAPEPEPEPEAPPVKVAHTVVKGECLWCIAEYEDIYADPFQWPLIYKANRDQIKDPDLIYPDQVFDIPRDSTPQDIEEAVHEAKTRGPWSLWDGK